MSNTNLDAEDDEVLNLMRKNRIPLTRRNYLELAFGKDVSDDIHPEHEAMLPAIFQKDVKSD